MTLPTLGVGTGVSVAVGITFAGVVAVGRGVKVRATVGRGVNVGDGGGEVGGAVGGTGVSVAVGVKGTKVGGAVGDSSVKGAKVGAASATTGVKGARVGGARVTAINVGGAVGVTFRTTVCWVGWTSVGAGLTSATRFTGVSVGGVFCTVVGVTAGAGMAKPINNLPFCAAKPTSNNNTKIKTRGGPNRNQRRLASEKPLLCSRRMRQSSCAGKGARSVANKAAVSVTKAWAVGRLSGVFAKVFAINCLRRALAAATSGSVSAISRSKIAKVRSRNSS